MINSTDDERRGINNPLISSSNNSTVSEENNNDKSKRPKRTGVNFGTISNQEAGGSSSSSRVSFDNESIIKDVQKRLSARNSTTTTIIEESKIFTKRITVEDADDIDNIARTSQKRMNLLYFFIGYISLFLATYLGILYGYQPRQPFIYMSCAGGVFGTICSLILLYQFSTLQSPARSTKDTLTRYYSARLKETILFPFNGSLNPPLALMYWRSFCDLLIGLRFVFIGLQFQYFKSIQNSSDFNWYRHHYYYYYILIFLILTKISYVSSGFLEFAEFSSEAWYFCLCLELLLSIR